MFFKGKITQHMLCCLIPTFQIETKQTTLTLHFYKNLNISGNTYYKCLLFVCKIGKIMAKENDVDL